MVVTPVDEVVERGELDIDDKDFALAHPLAKIGFWKFPHVIVDEASQMTRLHLERALNNLDTEVQVHDITSRVKRVVEIGRIFSGLFHAISHDHSMTKAQIYWPKSRSCHPHAMSGHATRDSESQPSVA